MKPLHGLALVLGVAQVAVLVTAARHHRHADDPTDRDGSPRGRGPGSHHRGPHHGGRARHEAGGPSHRGHGRPRDRGPGGRPDGPPPWMRERLEAWHRAQHDPADVAEPPTSTQDAAEEA